jgi:2-oxoglutarate ferredoxin oxidoreductase subunit alpha
MERLAHKFEVMRKHVPAPLVNNVEGAKIGFVAFGTSDYAVRESCDQLRDEYGIQASYLRLKAYPFTDALIDFIKKHDRVYVVDQNRDGQLLGLMRLEFDPELIAKLRSVRYYGGLPLDARTVTDDVLGQERGHAAAATQEAK